MNIPANIARGILDDIAEANRQFRDSAASLIVSAAVAFKNECNGRYDDFCFLTLLDAVSQLSDSDLSDEMAVLRQELGIDDEGYPVDEHGNPRGGRDFVPAAVKLARPISAIHEARVVRLPIGGGL